MGIISGIKTGIGKVAGVIERTGEKIGDVIRDPSRAKDYLPREKPKVVIDLNKGEMRPATPADTSGKKVSPPTTTSKQPPSRTGGTGGGGGGGQVSGGVVTSYDVAKDVMTTTPKVSIPTISQSIQNQLLIQQQAQRQDITFQQRNISQEQMLAGGYRQYGFTPSGRGTVQTYQKPYTEKEIGTLGARGVVSSTVATGEIARRENEIISNQFVKEASSYTKQQEDISKQKANEVVIQEQNRLEQTRNELTNKVNSGELKVKEANQLLNNEYQKSNEKLTAWSLQDLNDRKKSLEGYQKTWEETTGKQLTKDAEKRINKFSDRLMLEKTIATSPQVIIGSAVAIGLTGAIAPSVISAAGVLAGPMVAMQGSELVSAAKEGRLSKEYLASLVISNAAIIGGAYLGTRLIQGKPIDYARANEVLKRTDIKSKAVGIDSEFKVIKLNLPEGQQAQLVDAIKKGNKVNVVEYNLNTGRLNPIDRDLVNKAFPERSFKFIEVSNQRGQLINRVAVGEIKVTSAQGKLFKQDIQAKSEGIIDLKTGKFQTETITRAITKGKPEIELTLSREIGQSKQTISKPKLKGFETKVYTEEYGRIKVSPETTKAKTPAQIYKEIMSKSIKDLAKAQSQQEFEAVESLREFKPQPKSIGKIKEIQTQIEKNIRANLEKTSRDLTIGIKDKSLSISGGRFEKAVKPLDFEKVFNKPKEVVYTGTIDKSAEEILKSGLKKGSYVTPELSRAEGYARRTAYGKGVKTGEPVTLKIEIKKSDIINFDKAMGIKVKSIPPERISLVKEQKQISIEDNIKQLEKQFDLTRLPSTQSETIRKSIESASKEFSKKIEQPKLIKPRFQDMTQNIFKDMTKEQFGKLGVFEGRLSGTRIELEIEKNREKLDKAFGKTQPTVKTNINEINKQADKLSQIPLQKLNQKTIQRQIQKLNQQISIQTPTIRLPKIPDVFIPFGRGATSSGAGSKEYKKLNRQLKKFEGKYTSSLGAAFFQRKPIKVSRKEFERLSKVVFSGAETRPVLQIVSDKDYNKQLKKAVNF